MKLEDPPTVDRWTVVPPCNLMIWSETTKPVFLSIPFGPFRAFSPVCNVSGWMNGWVGR